MFTLKDIFNNNLEIENEEKKKRIHKPMTSLKRRHINESLYYNVLQAQLIISKSVQ